MLWSKVKTGFIVIFLLLDIAFLVLMGVTSAQSGLSSAEVNEIVTLCARYGITVSPDIIPKQNSRLPVLEARFMDLEDLPEEFRGDFTFSEDGTFVYQHPQSDMQSPKDVKAARKVLTNTLKQWGFDSADWTAEISDPQTARVCFSYQNHLAFRCEIDVCLGEDGILTAKGRWLWDVTVTQGATHIFDAPTVLAELLEEEELCQQGLTVESMEIGYFPESDGDGTFYKVFPLSPAYRIAFSNGEERIYFALNK